MNIRKKSKRKSIIHMLKTITFITSCKIFNIKKEIKKYLINHFQICLNFTLSGCANGVFKPFFLITRFHFMTVQTKENNNLSYVN